MNLALDTSLALGYSSLSQRIRVLTESWVASEAYCPACGRDLEHYRSNKPVADFFCPGCSEDFELKSKKNRVARKVIDGAYGTMIERLASSSNPSFFFLSYDADTHRVLDFMVVPKHFFVPDVIEKRKALSGTARRAGWVGCSILLHQVPQSGRIFYVRDGRALSRGDVQRAWRKTLFMRESGRTESRGWIVDVMRCVDALHKRDFRLDEMYGFEASLRAKHPGNKHVKDKIRQQLQFLRDKGYLEFLGRGRYRLTG